MKTSTENYIINKVENRAKSLHCKACDGSPGFYVYSVKHDKTKIGDHFDIIVKCKNCKERRKARWYYGEIHFF